MELEFQENEAVSISASTSFIHKWLYAWKPHWAREEGTIESDMIAKRALIQSSDIKNLVDLPLSFCFPCHDILLNED
jgi:hypothetical protein